MKTVAFCVLLLGFSLGASAKSGENQKFISQELIDTSILRAFVILNSSADMAGVGFGHKKSLTEAKKIAQTLKMRAKGDPNERYVLWKVSELEAQIYLEERDLVLQQMQKRQLTINELVAKYNSELGKWRPDFATLYRIHKSMDQVDAGKAGELADSYNKRKNALSRESVYFLEKALLAGDLVKARKELGFLLRNQMYLNVSSSTYKQLEDRVEGLYTARELTPVIKTGAQSAEQLLNRMDIVEARKTLDSAENRLNTIKKHLPQIEESRLQVALKRVHRKLEAKEDSLVDVNVAILRSQGVDAADRYLQAVLRPYGVSREKAANVDRMIISVKSPERSGPSAVDGLETDDDDASGAALDNVLFAARAKAQIKVDSLRKIEDARLWRERQEQARRDSIEQVARAAEEAAYQARQAKVEKITSHIYTLIEKNAASSAEKVLKQEQAFLKSNMRQDDFAMLKTTIDQFVNISMVPKAEIAYVSKVKQTASAPVPAAPPRNNLKANQKRAQEEILGIYGLLEQNEIGRAYKRFQTNREPLRKYLEPEVFNMLEMTVRQAYQYHTAQR